MEELKVIKNLPIAAPTKQEMLDTTSALDDTYVNYLSSLPDSKLRRIQNQSSRMRHGLQTTAPVMCFGPEKCLFIEHCPIPERTRTGDFYRTANGTPKYGKDSEYPVGRPCVMETLYMQQKVLDYMRHLDIQPENPIEVALANELALIDLYKNRALIILGKGDRNGDGRDFLKVDVTNYDAETGIESQSTQLHPVLTHIEQLEKRRTRILNDLVETRKSKIDAAHKLGKNNEDNAVTEQINQLKELIAMRQSNIEEAEVIEVTID